MASRENCGGRPDWPRSPLLFRHASRARVKLFFVFAISNHSGNPHTPIDPITVRSSLLPPPRYPNNEFPPHPSSCNYAADFQPRVLTGGGGGIVNDQDRLIDTSRWIDPEFSLFSSWSTRGEGSWMTDLWSSSVESASGAGFFNRNFGVRVSMSEEREMKKRGV